MSIRPPRRFDQYIGNIGNDNVLVSCVMQPPPTGSNPESLPATAILVGRDISEPRKSDAETTSLGPTLSQFESAASPRCRLTRQVEFEHDVHISLQE